jgi:hypothetical protein
MAVEEEEEEEPKPEPAVKREQRFPAEEFRIIEAGIKVFEEKLGKELQGCLLAIRRF